MQKYTSPRNKTPKFNYGDDIKHLFRSPVAKSAYLRKKYKVSCTIQVVL